MRLVSEMDNVLVRKRIEVEGISPAGGVIEEWTINRPDKLNALNSEVVAALKSACADAESDSSVRVVVIRGATPLKPKEGKRAKPAAFVAGADITEFVGRNSEQIRPQFEDNAWEAVWNLSCPTIASIDGFALGGGSELALSCDLRIATTRSKFGTPEINLGLIPGGGATQRLARLVGYGRALEMVMSGEMVDATKAAEMGLVNILCEVGELSERTHEVASNIAEKSPHALRIAKQAVRGALERPLTEGIEFERALFCGLFDTEDKEIGVNAFLSRQQPQWKGC